MPSYFLLQISVESWGLHLLNFDITPKSREGVVKETFVSLCAYLAMSLVVGY